MHACRKDTLYWALLFLAIGFALPAVFIFQACTLNRRVADKTNSGFPGQGDGPSSIQQTNVKRSRLRGCGDILFLLVWMTGWIGLSTLGLLDTIRLSNEYSRRLQEGRCQVAEGVVTVLQTGKSGGHDAGDQIAIGGVEFQYSYYDASKPGYRRIIQKGGRLTEGTKARVHYYDGALLKVEIAKDTK